MIPPTKTNQIYASEIFLYPFTINLRSLYSILFRINIVYHEK